MSSLEEFRGLQISGLRDQMRSILAQLESLDGLGSTDMDVVGRINLPEQVRQFEIELIKFALRFTGGHQSRAASLLKVKVSTLNSKIKLYGIPRRTLRTKNIAVGEPDEAT